jgi:hypothetical protein
MKNPKPPVFEHQLAIPIVARGARRILFTIDEFAGFGGAQMVVLELIEFFAENGWSVEVLTRTFGPPIAAELEDLRKTGILVVHQDSDHRFDPEGFDLVWVTHSLFPLSFLSALIDKRTLPRIVWSHFGSLDSLEAVNFCELETGVATRILCVSPRTQERMVESGLSPERMMIFDNPVPLPFSVARAPAASRSLEKILVVSNHPPAEVLKSRQAFASRGVQVLHIGAGGDFEGRVTPEVVSGADAVLTIGKTTQYCLVMGIPVFSYDHFGGAGWINAENYALESAHNFSGYRTQRKLTVQQIVDELWEGFLPTLAWAEANRQWFVDHYSLERQVTRVLGCLDDPPPGGAAQGVDLDVVEQRLRERWSRARRR